MRRSPIAFAVPMLVALHAAAQEEKPVSDLMAEAKAHFEAQCSLARSSASSAAGARQKDQAIMLTRLNCDCLPAELERVGSDLSAGKANATATPAAFLARVKMALNACAARIARADMVATCAAGDASKLGVANKPIYCGCLSEGLKSLDDDTIVIAAARTHKNFQDRARARTKGAPEPVPPPTAVDRLEQRCKELAS
jgi:hypothetical protein